MEPAEHHLRVPRTARYHVLGEPGGAGEIWFVLHGYRQLAARFIRRFAALPGTGDTRAVVAPEGLSRFYVEREVGPHGPESRVGASWMTRADREHEIRDYVEYLDRVAGRVLDADPAERLTGGERRIVVLGFSQGSETASRWVAHGRVRPDELILWGGGVAVDIPDDALRAACARCPTRLVVGRDDPWGQKRASESLRRLRSLDVQVDRIGFDGGHEVPAETLNAHWPG